MEDLLTKKEKTTSTFVVRQDHVEILQDHFVKEVTLSVPRIAHRRCVATHRFMSAQKKCFHAESCISNEQMDV